MHLITEAEIGVMCLQAKEGQGMQPQARNARSEKRQEGSSPAVFRERDCGPANTLIFYFKSPKLGENKYLLL